MYSVLKKKRHLSVKNKPILIIFGTQNPEVICHMVLIHLFTTCEKCYHATL